ncbi:hypothetical protein SDC9_153997 [bioreactor metagenome]|uniref:Uncharacterized protein n=1 Tax=bioreactor metagenome TaxID=1076179 RepID=A0A645EXK3_9ZZZZ
MMQQNILFADYRKQILLIFQVRRQLRCKGAVTQMTVARQLGKFHHTSQIKRAGNFMDIGIPDFQFVHEKAFDGVGVLLPDFQAHSLPPLALAQ